MSTTFNDDLLKALVVCREANLALEEEYEQKKEAITIPFRENLEKLLVERQPLMDKLNWADILDNVDAPTRKLLNGTTDAKIIRAIESLKVETRVKDNVVCRKVILKMRNNVFFEDKILFREIDANGKTVDISGVKWKAGSEVSRSNSLFRFFDEKAKEHELLLDALPAFEMVFQSPYLFMEKSCC